MSAAAEKGGVLKRALGYAEIDCARLMSERSFIIVYNLTLSTTKPITDALIRKCLQDWRDHYPMLRMNIVEEDGIKCFVENRDQDIDYERVDGEWLDFFNALLDTSFHECGPMWRARLVPESEQRGSPFNYVLLLSWWHVITDGTSNVTMCDNLMKRLDAALDGREMADQGTVNVHPCIEELLPKKEYLWSDVVEPLKEDLAMGSSTALWSKVFPGRKDVPVKTLFVDLGCLDEDETLRLVKRCKLEGTTVHAALLTAMHAALYELYTNNTWSEHSVADDSVNVVSATAVSMRRCYDSDDILGFHIAGFEVPFAISSETAGNFWQSAKRAGQSLRSHFNIDEIALKVLTVYTLHDGDELVKEQKENPRCNFDYGVANMRDIKSMFPGDYGNVTVTWLARSTSIQYYGFPFSFNATTFKGKFCLTVDYVTTHSTEEQVRFLGKSVMETLRKNV